MAIVLEQQRDLQRVRALSICYICGKAFVDGDNLNDDHLPPSGIFNTADRSPPLILRTHRQCNSEQSADDQVIAQLIGPIHGRAQSRKDRPLDIRIHEIAPGKTTGILRGQELERVVYRWIRGFHTALYGEHLPPPPASAFVTILPFPKTSQDSEEPEVDPIPDAYRPFLETITEAQQAGSADQIITRNDKCRYSCVWTQEDDGERWFCVYRLDVYNWSELGDVNNYERRECIGAYIRPSRTAPEIAARAFRTQQPQSSTPRENYMAIPADVRELFLRHRESSYKYIYFQLAAAAAALGFAVQKTDAMRIEWSMLPLGMAALSWAISFYCGCKTIGYLQSLLLRNIDLLKLKNHAASGNLGVNPGKVKGEIEETYAVLDICLKRSLLFSNWQFWLLVLGGVLFLVWHVLQMYCRSFASSFC